MCLGSIEALWGAKRGQEGIKRPGRRRWRPIDQPLGVHWGEGGSDSNTEGQLSLPLPGARPEKDKSVGWTLGVQSLC